LTLFRILTGHSRLFLSIGIGLASYLATPAAWQPQTQGITAWDIGAFAYLAVVLWLFVATPVDRMERNARAQQDGEWTLFWLVLAGAIASFVAIIGEFGSMKAAAADERNLKVALVAATLLLSWVVTQAAFALRYAHEFYSRTGDAAAVDGACSSPRRNGRTTWISSIFPPCSA